METLSNLPPSFDWQVYRNDTTPLTLVLNDTYDKPLDLTDWEFEGQVRLMPRSEEVVTTLTITKNENFLTVLLDNSELEQINYFDIQGVNETANVVSTILTGTIYVEEDVTR